MLVFTILFSSLFLQEILAFWFFPDYIGNNADPTKEWLEKHKVEFDELDISDFSLAAAHMLHILTVEDALTSLNIEMPIKNGIPSGNPDLTADESDAILKHVPSRPNQFSSPGMHGFVDFMDHAVDNNDWVLPGTKLLRLLHVFHMQETWAVARKAAYDFNEVSEDVCIGALDHANNGIEKGIIVMLRVMKNESLVHDFEKGMNWNDNGKSWTEYKAFKATSIITRNQIRSFGLYTQCLMRKFRQTEQPIGLDGCCDSKTVGAYSYTKVSKGKVPANCLNGCIYRREGDPDSRYCFAAGDEKVDNTKGCQN